MAESTRSAGSVPRGRLTKELGKSRTGYPYRAVDRSHIAGIRIYMYRIDRDLWLWDKLLVVVRFQIPDVDSAALISHNELSLGGYKAREFLALRLLRPLPPCSREQGILPQIPDWDASKRS